MRFRLLQYFTNFILNIQLALSTRKCLLDNCLFNKQLDSALSFSVRVHKFAGTGFFQGKRRLHYINGDEDNIRLKKKQRTHEVFSFLAWHKLLIPPLSLVQTIFHFKDCYLPMDSPLS